MLRFRGREIIYPELGWKVLRKVAEASQEIAVVSNSVNEGNSIVLVLSPVAQKKSKETGTDAKTQNP
jgi:translation initiation factor IF-3